MNNTNGSMRWLLWSAGIIMFFITAVLTFIGSNVVANDNSSRDRDDNIKGEMVLQERRLEKKIDVVQATINTNQTAVLVAIEGINGKLEYLNGNND